MAPKTELLPIHEPRVPYLVLQQLKTSGLMNRSQEILSPKCTFVPWNMLNGHST